MPASVAVQASHDDVGRVIAPALTACVQVFSCLPEPIGLTTRHAMLGGKPVGQG